VRCDTLGDQKVVGYTTFGQHFIKKECGVIRFGIKKVVGYTTFGQHFIKKRVRRDTLALGMMVGHDDGWAS